MNLATFDVYQLHATFLFWQGQCSPLTLGGSLCYPYNSLLRYLIGKKVGFSYKGKFAKLFTWTPGAMKEFFTQIFAKELTDASFSTSKRVIRSISR